MNNTNLLKIWREECERAPGWLSIALKSKGLRFDEAALTRIGGALEEAAGDLFQQRVGPWMAECFGANVSRDHAERSHRFLEEALELVQAAGCSASEAHQLVNYVFGRPAGELAQEVGGVMVTLAALCLAQGVDMHAAGDTELARVWTKIDVIRAKHAAKPKCSPLPGPQPETCERAERCPRPTGCDAHLGVTCSEGHMRLEDCPHWNAGSSVATPERQPAALPLMHQAFRTTETEGDPDPAKRRYSMVFDFPSLAALQAAEAEWISTAGARIVQQVAESVEPIRLLAPQPAPARDVVPGKVQCAKCGFSLQRINLYMMSGTTGAGGEETEPCPNDGTPLLPVTWEQEAREAWKMGEEQFDRAHALEAAGAELVACKDLKDEESRLRQRRDVAISRNREATAVVDVMRDDYNRRKPLAWAAMRALLPGVPARQAEAGHAVANYGTDLPFDGTDHRNVWGRDAALTKGSDHV